MLDKYYLGVDPGKSGAFALIHEDGQFFKSIKLSETQRDVYDWVKEYERNIVYAAIEKVHSMPRQGVASSFKFGESFGYCQGILVGLQVSFTLVRPQEWQKALKCMSKGDKNVTKNKAQQFWPKERITHAIADSMLIAYWAKMNSPF